MHPIHPSSKIYIAPSLIPHAGRGVFAQENINVNEIIETCPVKVLSHADYPLVKQTQLRNYYFMWGPDTCAICFGYGSFYNHSYHPNATYHKKLEEHLIEFVAIRNIKMGEEITVNYNYGNPDDQSKLWIEDIPEA